MSSWAKDKGWNRNPSRMVFAWDGSEGIVIWYVGADLAYEIEENSATVVTDLGIEAPGKGIWIWEGKYLQRMSYDDQSEPVGTTRQPNDVEWSLIREGVRPWKEEDWKR